MLTNVLTCISGIGTAVSKVLFFFSLQNINGNIARDFLECVYYFEVYTNNKSVWFNWIKWFSESVHSYIGLKYMLQAWDM